MGHIHIPAYNHWFLLIQLSQMLLELLIKFQAIGKCDQLPTRILHVNAHHEKLFKLSGYDSAIILSIVAILKSIIYMVWHYLKLENLFKTKPIG